MNRCKIVINVENSMNTKVKPFIDKMITNESKQLSEYYD